MDYLKSIWSYRQLIIGLAKNDFQTRYLGSYLGAIWAFVQPVITVGIMWFVFAVGFRTQSTEDLPFVLWLFAGMIPWTFFSEAIPRGTSAIIEQGYLVKKIVFRISLLPIIRLCSSIFVHCFFILLLLLIYKCYSYSLELYLLQIVYLLFSSCVLVFGIILITSSVVIFVKDVGEIVAMVMQFLFWATPIFWSIKSIDPSYHWIFYFNPFFYIINGYRMTLEHRWIFQEPLWTSAFFWLVTIIILLIGISIFKRLKPHFADVI